MYQILEKKTDTENGVEARLAKIDIGYSVGVWDLDAGMYYSEIMIFAYSLENALERAKKHFAESTKPVSSVFFK